jgi:hypothetical protein
MRARRTPSRGRPQSILAPNDSHLLPRHEISLIGNISRPPILSAVLNSSTLLRDRMLSRQKVASKVLDRLVSDWNKRNTAPSRHAIRSVFANESGHEIPASLDSPGQMGAPFSEEKRGDASGPEGRRLHPQRLRFPPPPYERRDGGRVEGEGWSISGAKFQEVTGSGPTMGGRP